MCRRKGKNAAGSCVSASNAINLEMMCSRIGEKRLEPCVCATNAINLKSGTGAIGKMPMPLILVSVPSTAANQT
jgi:hypothetical protein